MPGEASSARGKGASCSRLWTICPSSSEWVSASYVERNNLNIRMGVRRFTRLTNAFSKKLENHGAHVALWMAFYGLVRVHTTVRTTPAVAADVADREWELPELIEIAKECAEPPK